jgi:hypothetical protein
MRQGFQEDIQKAHENKKTKEMLLVEFKGALEKYGVKNVECRLEGGKLVVEQTLSEGIRGLGYDKEAKSLWLCLDQMDPETIRENQQWNTNTILSGESQLPGVKIEKVGEKIKIVISADHPIAALSRLMGEGSGVNLPGKYNNWNIDNPFKINEKTGELENELNWDGSETEVKVALTDVTADWEAGKWQNKAHQSLGVDLK